MTPPTPLRHQSSRPTPRSRVDEPNRDLLAKRLTTVNELRREMFGRWNKKPTERSKEIPVPLHAGETLQQYTREFERWLFTKYETFASLRHDPTRERGFWFSFAHIRAGTCGDKMDSVKRATESSAYYGPTSGNSNKRPRYSESSSYERERTSSQRSERSYCSSLSERGCTNSMRSREPQNCAKDGNKLSRHEAVYSRNATKEKVVVPKEKGREDLLAQPADSCKQTSPSPVMKQKLMEIPVPQETKSLMPQSDVQHRHASDSLSLGSLPIELKTRIGLVVPIPKPLYSQVEKKAETRSSDSNNVDTTSSGKNSAFQAHFETLPAWATQLVQQVQDLQNQVHQLQQEVKTFRNSHSKSVDSSHSEALKLRLMPAESRESSAPADVKLEVIKDGEHTAEKANSDAEILQRILFPSVDTDSYSRLKDDPEKRRLIAKYNYINTQIMANQTAIDDALVYVKTIKDIDKVSAAEHQSQIMELVVSVNQEKEKRASALAALIIYSWSGRHEALLSILDDDAIAPKRNTAKHEKWAAISSRIEEQDVKMKKLETQLNDQLQGARDSLLESRHLKMLRELSDKLTTEKAEKVALEDDQQTLLVSFLQCDKEIPKLVKELLRGSKRP